MIDKDDEHFNDFDTVMHGMGRELMKASLVSLGNFPDKEEWNLKFPHSYAQF